MYYIENKEDGQNGMDTTVRNEEGTIALRGYRVDRIWEE